MKFYDDENSWYNRLGIWLSDRPFIFAIVPALILLAVGGVVNLCGSSWNEIEKDL